MKKLYKTSYNKMVAGVCNGISEYFEVDPTIIRLVFVGLAFFGFTGIAIYIAAWIIMPEKKY